MEYSILFQQLLVLLTMMLVGYIAYHGKIIDNNGYNQLSALVVRVLNPFLMISGVSGKRIEFSSTVINQNQLLVCLFYTLLFITGFIYVKLIQCRDNRSFLYRMLILLPNVGFMGIPLVKEMLGSEYIVLVTFYILGFNLIAYTYGIYLSSKFGNRSTKINLKSLINPGTISALLSIIIFGYNLKLPAPVVSFVNYMGESCILLSMIVVGAFLAKTGISSLFLKKENIIFLTAIKFIVPIVMIFIAKKISFETNVLGVFMIMSCMPIGSATCMFAQEYGGDGTEAAHLVATTTIATIITAPAVFYLTNLF